MSLYRRNTQFGIPSIRGAPDSDEHKSNEEGHLLVVPDNDSLNKLKKRPVIDSVTIATRKDGLFVAVRKFSGEDADQKVKILQQIQQENLPNFLALQECFSFKGSFYAIFEHELTRNEKLLTLSHYALIKRYPTESQLAFILKQVLIGLEYLASKGLEHGAVRCKNILISTDGNIRIAGHEYCRNIGSEISSIKYIRGIGYVAMELMYKEAMYEGVIGVRDLHRWPPDSKAVNFLAVADSASSTKELAKHPLLTYSESEIDDIKADIRAN
ncbi:kinase-like domain-containing protein [Tricladium varicosporioides]|nr:kinase-like domain-containing protein [Hymenoscyphus varicosporioides]